MLRDVQATVAATPITPGLVDELAAKTVTVVSGTRARWYETNLLAGAIRQIRAAGVDPAAVNELARLVTRRAITEIGPNSLVIVDEAGLAATPKLDTAVSLVLGRGGRVLLVGDDRQRAAAGAGGALRDIDAAHGSSTLVEVLRFTHRTEAHATLAVREGGTGAVGFYTDRGPLHAVNADTGIDAVYRAWAAEVAAGADSVMMAPTLEQVAQLNARARARADRLAVEAAAGIPVGEELTPTNGRWCPPATPRSRSATARADFRVW